MIGEGELGFFGGGELGDVGEGEHGSGGGDMSVGKGRSLVLTFRCTSWALHYQLVSLRKGIAWRRGRAMSDWRRRT